MHALLLAASFLGSVGSPGADGDWFASLYTGEGVELRTDDKVFALYAVLNSVGYDVGPVTRKEPAPKVLMHPVRQSVRARVLGGDGETRKAADAFFDAHPLSARAYLAHVLGPKGKDSGDLKGFESLVSRAEGSWKMNELLATHQGEYRRALKAYLPVLDGPLGKLRKLLRVPETVDVTVVANLLEAHDAVSAVRLDDSLFVVVGPSDKPNMETLLREVARAVIEPSILKKAAQWSGAAVVYKDALAAGTPEKSPTDYAVGLVAEAASLRALEASDAAFDAASSRGYFAVKEITKLFDEGKSADALAGEAWARVEARRPGHK